jgi:hypothetical protein
MDGLRLLLTSYADGRVLGGRFEKRPYNLLIVRDLGVGEISPFAGGVNEKRDTAAVAGCPGSFTQ